MCCGGYTDDGFNTLLRSRMEQRKLNYLDRVFIKRNEKKNHFTEWRRVTLKIKENFNLRPLVLWECYKENLKEKNQLQIVCNLNSTIPCTYKLIPSYPAPSPT